MQQHYLRIGGGSFTPAVKAIIIINSAIFLIMTFALFPFHANLTYLFGLVPIYIYEKFFVWQFVTYMFVHGGLMHLLFNMLVLWMFGSDIERLWGTREFSIYYAICGIGAGLFNFVFQYQSMVPIVGSSGAIYGIMTAYAIYFGNRELYFMFMMPIKASAFVIMLGLIELISSIVYTRSGIAHLAHLGGLLFGFLYISIRFNRGWTDLLRAWHHYKLQRKLRRFRKDDFFDV